MERGEAERLWGRYRTCDAGLGKIKQVGKEKNNGVRNKRYNFWCASETH